MIWAASLFPSLRRRMRARSSVEDFERGMGVLAAETERSAGRWIIAPRKGERFMGGAERARARARVRRKRIFVGLLEAIGITILIGLVPPLRLMWVASAVLLVALGLYCWMLVGIRRNEAASIPRADMEEWAYSPPPQVASNGHAPTNGAARTQGAVSMAAFRRPEIRAGRVALDDGDLTHVIVRPAREVQAAGV